MSQSQGSSQSQGLSQSRGLSQGLSQSQGISQSQGQSQSQSQSQGASQSQGFGDGPGPGDGLARLGRTGGGMASGSGFVGGYGFVPRSAYATPASLGPKPWAQDFLVSGGQLAYPTEWRINPNALTPKLEWRTEDWDPGLRIWALPQFDPQLTEWLQDADLAAPATMVAREYAAQHQHWRCQGADLRELVHAMRDANLLQNADVAWTGFNSNAGATPGAPPVRVDLDANTWTAINGELEELVMMMQDSRARYQQEALAQNEGVGPYFMHLLGVDPMTKPWTFQLFQCAVAISNVTYMYYKGAFKRVRPSTLCPGLVPPFGPPHHPSFPSGHAMLGYTAALLLLRVPGIAALHGVGITPKHYGKAPGWEKVWEDGIANPKLDGSLLWLAARLAKNREQIGVHYASDSSAGRHLAGRIGQLIFREKKIVLPTLEMVIRRARAEWPEWPPLSEVAELNDPPPPPPPAPAPAPV